MREILLIFTALFFLKRDAHSQTPTSNAPELKIAYFGNYVFRPGMSVGIAFPFSQTIKEKAKTNRKIGQYILTKQHDFKIGSNLAFYHHPKDHNGYLLNAEITWHRIKNKSFKPERYTHLEWAIGLGYFRYQLLGTTFTPDNGSFREINGNGNAFMPSVSLAWGRNIKAVKNMDMRYFFKPSFLLEIPYNAGLRANFSFEIGVISKIKMDNNKK